MFHCSIFACFILLVFYYNVKQYIQYSIICLLLLYDTDGSHAGSRCVWESNTDIKHGGVGSEDYTTLCKVASALMEGQHESHSITDLMNKQDQMNYYDQDGKLEGDKSDML